MRVPLGEIRLAATLQPREEMIAALIDEYAGMMRGGVHFDPVELVHDGQTYWLVDGYHRYYAMLKVKPAGSIEAKVHTGDFRLAQLMALKANWKNGQRRSRADIKRAILLRLEMDAPWKVDPPFREIAREIGCVHDTVRVRWNELLSSGRFVHLTVTEDVEQPEDEPEPEPESEPEAEEEQPAAEPPEVPALIQPKTLYESRGILTLTEWHEMKSKFKIDLNWLRNEVPAHTKSKFNDQKTDDIEWARHSWNPVPGCKHTCPYCYARDIAGRSNHYPQGFEPSIIPDRLAIPRSMVVPPGAEHDVSYRNVFTDSMGDLFGRWVPQEWIDLVFEVVRDAPDWNFLMLTKFPKRMAEQVWPDNVWAGTSIDGNARIPAAEAAFKHVKAGIRWLSCEPMLEQLTFTNLKLFQWVVIGGQSANSQVPAFNPPWEWIEDLVGQARAAKCQIYFKTNLRARPREYPQQGG